jgi:hypothetical protein
LGVDRSYTHHHQGNSVCLRIPSRTNALVREVHRTEHCCGIPVGPHHTPKPLGKSRRRCVYKRCGSNTNPAIPLFATMPDNLTRSSPSIFENGKIRPGVYKIRNIVSRTFVDTKDHVRELCGRPPTALERGGAQVIPQSTHHTDVTDDQPVGDSPAWQRVHNSEGAYHPVAHTRFSDNFDRPEHQPQCSLTNTARCWKE